HRGARAGVSELKLQLQRFSPCPLAPELLGFEAPAAALLQRGLAPQPAQRRQLLAVAQAVVETAAAGCLLEPLGELLLPPVRAPYAGGHQSERDHQPEAGQPVTADGQGGRARETDLFYAAARPRSGRWGQR
ncbi:MAG: hypothetical protein ACK56I_22575, partial [bacterium]